MQRIPLSDEYDPDFDLAADSGDPIEDFLVDKEGTELRSSHFSHALPIVFDQLARINIARCAAKKEPQPMKGSSTHRKFGC